MNQEIDPFTGLPLKTIGVTAPQRAVTNPFEAGPVISQPLPIEPIATPEVKMAEEGLPKTSLLEGIIFGLTGPADSDLSPEKRAQKQADRGEAQQLANSATGGQGGSQYMNYGGGAGSGGSAIESLGKLFQLFAGKG